MIFKYTYINHDAEKLHELVEHIVLDVWCNARGQTFNINLIKEENNFRAKVSRTSVYLKKPIEEIFDICALFDDEQIEYIKDAFDKNNQIEELCKNRVDPIFYNDLKDNTSEDFSKKIKAFFKGLYEEVFNQKPFYVKKHYDEFFKNNEPLCPFCGINTLAVNSSNHRDAYDHYLPKESYPFNAVNLKNLFPMCNDCNEKEKSTKNPIKDDSTKVKSFYYYGNDTPSYKINIEILNVDIENFNVEVSLTSDILQEEVNTWNRLFSLSRRYKDDVICHNKVGKAWIREVWSKVERKKAKNETFDLDDHLYEDRYDLLSNKNFIKVPLLESCKARGII